MMICDYCDKDISDVWHVTSAEGFFCDDLCRQEFIAEDDTKAITRPKSLLAPDCAACGGDKGKHKLGCPVVKGKK
jgi:hypothetical protein